MANRCARLDKQVRVEYFSRQSTIRAFLDASAGRLMKASAAATSTPSSMFDRPYSEGAIAIAQQLIPATLPCPAAWIII